MFKRVFIGLLILFCSNSGKSQNKKRLPILDLSSPKIFYPSIGELRGEIKEISVISKSSDPIHGTIRVSEGGKYVIDSKKKIINRYDKKKLSLIICLDTNLVIDTLKLSSTLICYLHKTHFRESYVKYLIEDGVKLALHDFPEYKFDSIGRTVSSYINNKIISIDSFDVKNRKILTKSSIGINNVFTYYEYNNDGDLIATYSKYANQRKLLIKSSKYEYDQNRNWIKQTDIDRPDEVNSANNIFKTIIERKIVYDSN